MGRQCYLKFLSNCEGKITGEHYISNSILRQTGHVSIKGLDWQKKGELQKVGRASLTANILCEKHNSELSELDVEAGKLFKTLHQIDKTPDEVNHLTKLSGHSFERWMLKLTVGLVSGPMKRNHLICDEKKKILLTNVWPEGWGLYVQPSSNPIVFEKTLEIELRKNPISKEVLAIKLYFSGFESYLCLGVPDNPRAFGIYRPRGLIFKIPVGEKRVEFLWPHDTNHAVTYTKIGVTKERRQPWRD